MAKIDKKLQEVAKQERLHCVDTCIHNLIGDCDQLCCIHGPVILCTGLWTGEVPHGISMGGPSIRLCLGPGEQHLFINMGEHEFNSLKFVINETADRIVMRAKARLAREREERENGDNETGK